MEPRLNMFENAVGANFAKRFANTSTVIDQSSLPKSTQELVSLRASQIKCASITTTIRPPRWYAWSP